MSLGVIPWTIISIFNSKLIGQEKTKFVLGGAFIRVFSEVILLILLGEHFGIIGLALAMTLSLIFHSVSAAIFYKFATVKEYK